jgi:hypothetical protein
VKTGAENLDDQSTSLFPAAFARQMGGSVEQRGPEPGITIIELLISMEKSADGRKTGTSD